MAKLMMLILVAAFAGLFFISGPNGEPILQWQDLMPEMPETEPQVGEPTKVYKWQDENGVWQFSNQPQDAMQGETLEYDGNINTMPAVAVDKIGSQPKAKTSPDFAIPAGITTVSGDQAEEMMETINSLSDTMDERQKQLDQLSGNN